MSKDELKEVISKYQLPIGNYSIKKEGNFGESEFFWVIKNKTTNKEYLLVNTYSHHGIEDEIRCYQQGGFNSLEPIPRKIETLEVKSDTNGEIYKYLFGLYSIFEIKS